MNEIPSNVKHYLDLSTWHLTHDEMNRLSGGPTTVVIRHRHGCWVHVPDTDTEQALLDEAAQDSDPIAWDALSGCYDAARDLDCNWINFDADADKLASLPVHEW